MPALDILGYLWMKRQELDIQTKDEAVSLAADLMTSGLDCIQIEDVTMFGLVVGARASYPRKTKEEWDELVHRAIVDASVAHTVHMMTAREGDDE